MEKLFREFLSENEKVIFIEALTKELSSLRAKAGLSQEEVANLIGVSRQTYGAMERRKRKMSWNTYLSLILFYDYNKRTHEMIRNIDAFPHELIKRFNDGEEPGDIDMGMLFNADVKQILEALDDQAISTLKTILIVEYSRCKNLDGEAAIRLFEGLNFTLNKDYDEQMAAKALKNIKRKKRKNG